MGAENFNIICPCCDAKLTVHPSTGAILAHEKPPQEPAKSFEQAFSDEKRRREDAADRFAQSVKEHENRDEILEKKFREAFKKAEKDDKPPPHPFDYD